MTKKARYIEKLDALSAEQKKAVTDFFTKYPNYEKHIDWNSTSLTYHDFEDVFALAENSLKNIKRKRKTDPRLLFEKYNCEIIRQTDDFLIVVPLDWECAVFFNSFHCGGEGARWCIGAANDASHWNSYLEGKNIFFLIYFVNKHPLLKKKTLIEYNAEDGECTLSSGRYQPEPSYKSFRYIKRVIPNQRPAASAQAVCPGLCAGRFYIGRILQ
jgi:hypothetical protein